MVVPITEVIDVVSGDRIFTVVQGTEVRALASPSEVGLQGGCASVENRDGIGVVGPRVSESSLKTFI